ncbi:hypothetical protein [Pseudoxanthomonas putridarboris]|uniref:Lipoprotein n=1 Tax=Pseudoxanthomonas putridarboris TaxID=752605 RepID=A0ABU9IVR6_9GAMM
MIRAITVVIALMALTGCDRLGASLGMSEAEPRPGTSTQAAVVVGEETSAVAEAVGIGDPAPAVVPEAAGAHLDAGAAVQAPAGTADLPPDGPEYQQHLLEVRQAAQTGSPGRLIGIPSKVSATGYPIYPATCTFYPDHAECELASGEVVDEAYLQAHTTVIRNADVLSLGMTCGVICIDDHGNVLGHVSQAMQAWRDQHCTWVDYGTSRCD